MPNPAIKSFVKQTGKSEKELEKIWNKAKAEAEEMDQGDNYAYVMDIFKTMVGLDESINSKPTTLAEAFQRSEHEKWDEFIANFDETLISSDFETLPESPVERLGTETEEGEEYDNIREPEWEQEGYNL